jgi:hypothetical protein
LTKSRKFEDIIDPNAVPEEADDDDIDYETGEEDDDTPTMKRLRQGYMPPKNSTLGIYLEGIRKKKLFSLILI